MYEQDRFIVRLRQQLNSNPAISAAWLGGSYGRNQPDPFSDIDITLVFVDAAARDRAWSQRTHFCQNILAYVAAKSQDHPLYDYRHNVLYANGTLADVAFFAAGELQPRHEDSDIKIVKDSADKIAETQQMHSVTLGIRRELVRSADLKSLDDSFWIQFWAVYRVVRRGDTQKPFVGYIQLLAAILPKLIGWLLPNSPERQQLIDLHYTLNATTTRAHLQSLVTAYLAARAAVIKQNRLDFPIDRAFEREMARVLRK